MTKSSKKFIKFNANQQIEGHDYCTHIHASHTFKKVPLFFITPKRDTEIHIYI